jgi:UDP-N-acetyl-D-glucosamine dehydrogenase
VSSVAAEPSASAPELCGRFKRREATVGVIGLGYVGLPLCIALCEAGFAVLGFDVDPAKPEAILAGRSYLKHIGAERTAPHVASGRLGATTDMARLGEPDAILICVPTPLTAHHEPDLSYVVTTTEQIGARLRKGQLVVLESTTYPGTTAEVVQPILERASGLVAHRDFFLGFSPEREDPGNADYSTATIPKVVGADQPASIAAVRALYEAFIQKVTPVSSSAAAEAVKITENIFRSVNIALVNELKTIYAAMGINVWEVIDAAKTKPFGFMAFYPGPGLGGHCIPIDPFYLTWKAKEFNITTRFIELAGEINSAMPGKVVAMVMDALNSRAGKALNGSRILMIGVAYKKNVDDTRESPALTLIELLEARGAKVEFHDPLIAEIPRTREHAELTGRRSWAWDERALGDFDCALVVTDHDDIDYQALARRCRLVVDTRNACARAGAPMDKVVLA